MKDALFPLDFTFKVTTLSNDFTVQDASGLTVSYVKQKLFKLVEEVKVFNDESQAELLYSIKANKWIDFSAAYTFTDGGGREIGRVARKGWASMWKAHYEVFDQNQDQDFIIREENAWIRVGDALLGQLPVVSLLTGYFFNPSYLVTRPDGTTVARLKKQRSFFGRRFTVSQEGEFQGEEAERVTLSLMMMILLERRRG
ncbi:hypothetical protein TH63_09165 [Rufibacter radiotolerans]|uniref:Uncharacterized protein n=1 Tax=Rufibacter radiotolerans TaxID=1379910 RepID=A0A0H4W5T1_9BACT|nr:hypothetical protein [Rufibacter radiotolerans]AKQ45781.1 hypothetical protein TH63_09165 [Rufibacter radiotolerans]